MINPCECRGDVSAVHHDCLQRWLMEVSAVVNDQFYILDPSGGIAGEEMKRDFENF